MDELKRIKQLRKELKRHADLYYTHDTPEISDYEYDMLQRELKALELKHPEAYDPDSVTVSVGGSSYSTFEKVRHEVFMGSLTDIFNEDEISKFISRVHEEAPGAVFSVEPKIDGLSVSLEYENGVFTRGSTRGNGAEGEDVTENLRVISSIPKKLPDGPEFLEVRGEVFMPRRSFEELLKTQEERGGTAFKNPRNAAAGSLRQKDSCVTAERGLDIFIFNVQQIRGRTLRSHIESLDYLRSLGFKVCPSYKKVCCFEDAVREIKAIALARSTYDFDIDGAVLKADDLSLRTSLGEIGGRPKWAVAFKYPPEEKESRLIDIEVNVGRTGAVTPTAVLEPVLLAGTTVSRAILHNQDFINEKGIAIGDTVLLRKAAEIIPEIISVTKKAGGSVYSLPKDCPSCGEKLVREEDEAVLRCVNSACPAQIERSIIHFCSRDAMNIEGMGEANVSLFYKSGLISAPEDLYSLKNSDISAFPRMGEKSAANLIAAIEKSKSSDLSRVIFALGIRNIGKKAAEVLADTFGSLSGLMAATWEDISAIDGFGPAAAENIVDFFSSESNLKRIEALRSCGIDPQAQNIAGSGTALSGKTFVVTGTLENLSRPQAEEMIKRNGGKVSSSVSKKTDYLLCGDNAGSKLEKAQSLGIKIISLSELGSMLD